MFHPLPMQPQKVGIVGHDDTFFIESEINVSQIVRAIQSCIPGRRHVDASLPQALCDGCIDMLVQVKLQDEAPRSLASSGPGPILLFNCCTNSPSSRICDAISS